MLKTSSSLVVLTSMLAAGAPSALADDHYVEKESAREATDVAVGVSVGEPTGLSARLGFGRNAFTLAAGVDYQEHQHLHLDYTNNLVYLPSAPGVSVPLYFGVGAFVKDHPEDVGPHGGVRVPIGIQASFSAPVQLYGEIVPSVVVLDPDEMYPHQAVSLDGAIGVRARFE